MTDQISSDHNDHLTSNAGEEVVYVTEHRVSCDGDGGALGHPRVWYSLEDGKAECGYCDRIFIYAPKQAAGKA